MRLFFKVIVLLAYAITGSFSFYLVVINFLDHLDAVSKAGLFFQLFCAVILTVSGAILFYRMKLAAIVAVGCQLGLIPLWLNYAGIRAAEAGLNQNGSGELYRNFLIAYCISLVLSITVFFLKNDEPGVKARM